MTFPLTSVSTVIVINEDVPSLVMLKQLDEVLAGYFTDIETIIVANGAAASFTRVKELIQQMPDTTCLALNEQLDLDAANLVGMENAIGDYVVLVTPIQEAISSLPAALGELDGGSDAVFAEPAHEQPKVINLFELVPYAFLSWMTGARLSSTPIFLAILNREAALHVLSKPNAEIILKSRTLGPGFVVRSISTNIRIPASQTHRSLLQRAAKAVRLLVTIGATPLRFIGALSLTSSLLSLLYVVYVMMVYVFKSDVEKGWTTLSLQVSGMMFLFSIMFFLLSEYMVQIYGMLAMRRRRIVVRELRSGVTRRTGRLNVVDEAGEYRLGAATAPDGTRLPAA
jgi:hypothetical protein